MRLASLTVLISLSGCKQETAEPISLVAIQGDEPISIQLHDAVGSGSVHVPIRQVNSYGIGVPGGTAMVAVRNGGSIPGGEVSFDAYGYGNLYVDVPNGTVAEVQVQSAERTDDIGGPAKVYGVSTAVPDLPLAPTTLFEDQLSDARWIAPGTDGVVVGSEDEIWWTPLTQGQPPHQIADLPFLIDGMWGTHVDADGILDLVVWADTQVILMRGRAGGGYGWGGAWSAGDQDIAGVVASDVDGDRLADLVVAMTTDDDSLVEVLIGDGRWNFDAMEPLRLSYPVEGVTATDDTRDGDPDITVLSGASGVLRRYTVTDDGWVGGTPPEIAAYKAEPGSILLPPIDIDNRGAPEVAVIGPPEAGEQKLVFYVLGAPPTKYPLSFYPFHATFADVDANGADDLIALEDNVLNMIRFSADGEKFISQSTLGMGEAGPIASRDFDGDGLADVAILSNGVTVRHGVVPDIGGWSVKSHGMRSYSLNLVGPISIDDFDGNGKTDVIAVSQASETPKIKGWFFVEDDDGLPALQSIGGSIETEPGTALLDYTRCDNNIYALVGNTTSRTMYRVKINTSSPFSLTDSWGGKSVANDAFHIACGVVSSGVDGVVVANNAGDWTTYKNDSTALDSGNAGPAGGIVLGDTNGDGVDEVFGCDTADCELLAFDVNGDGRDEILESGTGITPTPGTMSTQDVDGDGRLDLLTFDIDSGTLSIQRGMDNGVAPAFGIRTEREVIGPGVLADVDGNGSMEFLTVDAEGKLVHTRTVTD
jgi:hypothetical protein